VLHLRRVFHRSVHLSIPSAEPPNRLSEMPQDIPDCVTSPPAPPRPPTPSLPEMLRGFRYLRSTPKPRTHTYPQVPHLRGIFQHGAGADEPPISTHHHHYRSTSPSQTTIQWYCGQPTRDTKARSRSTNPPCQPVFNDAWTVMEHLQLQRKGEFII